MVLPGAEPTRAKFLRLRSRFITDDLPTFYLPANATAGMLLFMNCFGWAADLMNSALLTFNAGILTSLTYRAAQLLRLERN